jgi:hypothetical protein
MPAQKQPKRRVLVRYELEDGSAVEIACFGSIDTATAIRHASTMLGMKSEELGKSRAPVALAKTG